MASNYYERGVRSSGLLQSYLRGRIENYIQRSFHRFCDLGRPTSVVGLSDRFSSSDEVGRRRVCPIDGENRLPLSSFKWRCMGDFP